MLVFDKSFGEIEKEHSHDHRHDQMREYVEVQKSCVKGSLTKATSSTTRSSALTNLSFAIRNSFWDSGELSMFTRSRETRSAAMMLSSESKSGRNMIVVP